MRADLCTAQSQFANATFQFLSSQIRVLKRDRRQTSEAFRMFAHYIRDVIVQPPRKIERVVWFRPVTEHHRHGREGLHRNAAAIHFLDPPFRFPNVVFDFPKEAITNHHARAAFIAVLEPNESRITKLFVQVRPGARQNVGVDVDFHEEVISDL